MAFNIPAQTIIQVDPLGQELNVLAQGIATDPTINIVNPRNLKEESLAFFYNVFKACSPEIKHHPYIFTPSIIVFLFNVFLAMLLFNYVICPGGGTGVEESKDCIKWDGSGSTTGNCTEMSNAVGANSTITICTETFLIVKWGGFQGLLAKTEGWRLLTYSIHHLNFLHIFSNAFIITLGGYMMEVKYGALRLFIIYFGSVIGGGLFAWWWYPLDVVIIGASAGAYGLIFLFIADLILNWESVKYKWFTVILSIVVELVYLLKISSMSMLPLGRMLAVG